MVDRGDASSPIPWPPIIYGLAAIAAAILTFAFPFPLSDGLPAWAARSLGGLVLAAGFTLLASAGGQFKKAGTPMPPIRPTTAIVTAGIYGYTRNPMYLGMTLMLLGLCLAASSLWFLVAAPVAMFAVTKLAIEREESYLERKFGAPYLAYKAQVRRWL